MYGLDI